MNEAEKRKRSFAVATMHKTLCALSKHNFMLDSSEKFNVNAHKTFVGLGYVVFFFFTFLLCSPSDFSQC